MNMPDIPTGERREQFKMRVERIGKLIAMKCPAVILELEMRLAIEGYNGGVPKLCWRMFKNWLIERLELKLQSVAIWIADRVGWTKVYDVPETDTMRAYKMRHGYKCHGSPNCNNMDCISDCLPKWFKWITRHPKL